MLPRCGILFTNAYLMTYRKKFDDPHYRTAFLKPNQVLLIILIVIAGYLAWQEYDEIYGNKDRLSIWEEGDAVVFSWSDDIQVPMAKRFEEAFNTHANKTNKFIIKLNSRGGSLREGRLVIEAIDRMKRSHEIETRVGFYASCLSMCVPIYLQGDERVASAYSNWMFHQPIAVDPITGETLEISDAERAIMGAAFFNAYFVNSEMNEFWRKGLEREWVGKDVWRTGQQLVDENSNIVQELY